MKEAHARAGSAHNEMNVLSVVLPGKRGGGGRFGHFSAEGNTTHPKTTTINGGGAVQ